MGRRSGKEVQIWWLLSPDEEWLKYNHPELDHMTAISYNLYQVAHAYAAMPLMRWAWLCNNSLADYRRHHFPHYLEGAGNYAGSSPGQPEGT